MTLTVVDVLTATSGTATLTVGSPFPSGTVAFYDGNNQIGTTQTVTQTGTTDVGTASISITTLTAGIHGDITAQYTPTPGNGLIASGSSMNLVVGVSDRQPDLLHYQCSAGDRRRCQPGGRPIVHRRRGDVLGRHR